MEEEIKYTKFFPRANTSDTEQAARNHRRARVAAGVAVEGFTDELAAQAGVDPIAFRTSRLTDPRAVRGGGHYNIAPPLCWKLSNSTS